MSRSIVALSLQHEGCYTARTGPDHSESEVAGIREQLMELRAWSEVKSFI